MSIKKNLKALILRAITKKKNIEFDIKNSSKVLMLRYDRIGDMIITTPVFRELKNAYPHMEINVIASKLNSIVLKNNPHVDNIYLNNKNNLLFDLPVLLKLRKKQIDVCFEFDHSVVKHAILRLKIINPKKVISVKKDGRYGVKGHDLEIYDYYVDKSKNTHFRDIWLSMLNPLGIQTLSNHYDIFFNKKHEIKADNFLNSFGENFLIGINLEGAVKGKKIQYKELKEICMGLFKINSKVQIIIISSPNKEQLVKREIMKMNLEYVASAYKTVNILAASALIKNLDMIITPDTSIAHIASTFNKPVITIHENNFESYKLFAPTSDLNRTIFSSNNNSLEGFSVDSLLDACQELIDILQSE